MSLFQKMIVNAAYTSSLILLLICAQQALKKINHQLILFLEFGKLVFSTQNLFKSVLKMKQHTTNLSIPDNRLREKMFVVLKNVVFFSKNSLFE
jgi:hypothetical protein